MEVLVTRPYVILKDKDQSLWFPRGPDVSSYDIIPKCGKYRNVANVTHCCLVHGY